MDGLTHARACARGISRSLCKRSALAHAPHRSRDRATIGADLARIAAPARSGALRALPTISWERRRARAPICPKHGFEPARRMDDWPRVARHRSPTLSPRSAGLDKNVGVNACPRRRWRGLRASTNPPRSRRLHVSRRRDAATDPRLHCERHSEPGHRPSLGLHGTTDMLRGWEYASTERHADGRVRRHRSGSVRARPRATRAAFAAPCTMPRASCRAPK